MDVDYRLAFDLAPVGLVLSRNRTMVDCNRHVCEMFGASREVLMGQSFQILYPSADEYERLGAHMAPILNAKGHYAEEQAKGAERAKYFAKGTEIVGDEAKHNALREWAKANIPADELTRFSKVAATDPALYPMIVRELNARYTESIGAAGTKLIVQGTNGGPAGMPTNREQFLNLKSRVDAGDIGAIQTFSRLSIEQIMSFA